VYALQLVSFFFQNYFLFVSKPRRYCQHYGLLYDPRILSTI